MSNGPLFNAKHLTVRAEREDVRFSTPLGVLRFFVELDGEALPVSPHRRSRANGWRARKEDGAYDGGEALTSMMWENKDVQVSLGTLDEDYMSGAALRGWLPRRLAPIYDCAFTDEAGLYARFWPQAIGRVDGLQIPLPPLLKGEAVQLHMVAAWHRGEYDTSTWYAVEIDPKTIEWLVEKALRDGDPIDARVNPFQAPDPGTP